METSARNLVIALALPHLSREEDRVDFLAEQAVLGALYLRGPAVARKAIRRMADRLSDPLIIEAAAHLIAGISGAYPSVEFSLLGVAELLSRAAGDLRRHTEPAAATPAAPPSKVSTGGDADLAAPEGVRAPEPPAPSDATDDLGYVIVLESVGARPGGLAIAIAEFLKGEDLSVNEALVDAWRLVEKFREGEQPLAVARANSREVAEMMCSRIADAGIGARAGIVPAAQWKKDVAANIAQKRVVLAVQPVDGAPLEAVRYPEPSATGDDAAADAPPMYSVVLTLNCCTPRDGLVRAIRDCVVDRGDGAGLPFDEAHAYAETLVQNFRQGEPVIVAKSASRESADIMCRAIIRTGARASVIPSVVPAGESAADNAAWHSLMLVDRGAPPWSGLAHAIAKITTPTSEIIVGDHPYVRAAKLIDNFTTPVEIARYESQATAERVRARLAERVGELGARFAVVLSEPPPPRIDAPEAHIPPRPTALGEHAVPKRRAKKPRRSR